MMIKIKVKHLIYFLLILFIMIPVSLFVISPQIQLYKTKELAAEGKLENKMELLQLLDSPGILNSQKWQLIEDYMLSNTHYNVYVGPSYSQVNDVNYNSIISMKDKMPFIMQYIENAPHSEYLVNATNQAALYYMNNSKPEEAEAVFNKAMNRGDKFFKNDLLLEKIDFYIQFKKYEKARELVNEQLTKTAGSEVDYYYDAKLKLREAEIDLKEGQHEVAFKKVNDALKVYEEEEQKEKEEFGDDGEEFITDVNEELLGLQKRLKRIVAKGASVQSSVKGRIVKSDGTPVSHAGVFLRKEGDAYRSVSELEPYKAVTDKDGFYQIDDVMIGSYQLNLGLNFDQIDGWTWPVEMDDWIDIDSDENIEYDITLNKLIEVQSPINETTITDNHLEFSWKQVKDAAYYELHLGLEMEEGGSFSTLAKAHISDNRIDVSLEDLYTIETGRVLADDDSEYHSPKQLLGFANPETRFYWSVNAYKENGELISRSDGYRLNEATIGGLPFFYLKERELTKADELLFDKEYKQALETYKADYENDREDLHSLRMITRLIAIDSSNQKSWEATEAIPYLTELAEKTGSPDIIFRLLEYYSAVKNWDNYNQWREVYLTKIDGSLDAYDQAVYAQALMHQGDLEQARDEFRAALDKGKDNRFIGNLLAVELYLGASFEDVLELAEKYPERPLGSEEEHDWKQKVLDLRDNSIKDDLYRSEMNEALEHYFYDDETTLNNWLKTADDKVIKQFIEAEKKVN